MAKCADGKHIVVINDTPAILDLFTALLEDEGYKVTTDTFNAVAAGDKKDEIARLAPDLVILDFIIGGEGLGWQLLQLLRMDRTTRAIPVVICTAAVRQVEELQSHLDELGIAVVLKPFDIDRLLAVVSEVLSPERRRGAQDETSEKSGPPA